MFGRQRCLLTEHALSESFGLPKTTRVANASHIYGHPNAAVTGVVPIGTQIPQQSP